MTAQECLRILRDIKDVAFATVDEQGAPQVRIIDVMLVEEGKLSAGHARALLPLSPALQENAAGAVISGGLSVRQTEALAKRLSLEKPEKAPAPKGIDYAAEAQKELSSKLGRGVRIVTGRKKGRIELEYYGIDDLNDLLEALAMLRAKQTKTP